MASPTATEGFGFTYADKVGALALLTLLARLPFTDQDLGVVTQVQFGQRPAGWHFDDLLLTLDHLGTANRLAISIKSASHITGAGVNKEIVDLVWLQLTDGGPLEESTDRLALVQPSIGSTLSDEVNELYRWAHRQADGQLPTWLQPGVSNNLKRTISESVLSGQGRDDPQRFFRAFQFLPLDLDPPQDQDSRRAIETCLAVLKDPSEALASSLWAHLQQLSADVTSPRILTHLEC